MSEVLKPINPEEYESFYRELYSKSDGGIVFSQFRVALDKDPSLNPKALNEKLAQVQSLKDRLVVILNRAVKNEQYWKTVSNRLENRYESEKQRAYLLPDVKKEKNAEGRTAMATDVAKKNIITQSFRGEGLYENKVAEMDIKHAESIAFLSEVKNIYENLDAANMGLAVQLKSIMANMRIYGGPQLDGGQNGGRPC